MGPTDLLILATVVLIGMLMLICWVLVDRERRR